MKSLLLIIGVFFLCAFTITRSMPCTSILPPDPPSHCDPASPDERSALRMSIKTQLLNVNSALQALSATVKSQPNFSTWFRNASDLGFNFNPSSPRNNSNVIGRAGLTLENCFFPDILNLTLAEVNHQMSCPSNINFAARMFAVFEAIPSLVADFKRLSRTDNRVTEGNSCPVTLVICRGKIYPTTRSYDGLPFTEEQERLRRISNTGESLNLYLSDLDHNSFWTTTT